MMSCGPPPSENQKKLMPSTKFCSLVRLIHEVAAVKLPPVLHEGQIMNKFLTYLNTVEDIKKFELCFLHEEYKDRLLKDIAKGALNDVLSLNETWREKKKEQRELRKMKIVTHK